MSEDVRKATDWNAYYQKKRSWFSTFTQRYTLREIIKYIKTDYRSIDIIELGGGNSCFAKSVCDMRRIDSYDIIDNNELAVRQFDSQRFSSSSHKGYRIDLLNDEVNVEKKYDFVYSVGLIEHFLGEDVSLMIKRHFEYCKDNGIVLITFPTPTKKYLYVRNCMEKLKLWQFYDEVPLRWKDVSKVFEENGKVVARYINKNLPLSQMIVVVRKK